MKKSTKILIFSGLGLLLVLGGFYIFTTRDVYSPENYDPLSTL